VHVNVPTVCFDFVDVWEANLPRRLASIIVGFWSRVMNYFLLATYMLEDKYIIRYFRLVKPKFSM